MPLYYFDVHDGSGFSDDDGTECANADEMRREALRTAGGMISEETHFRTGAPWAMIVRDAKRAVVAKIELVTSTPSEVM